MNMLSAMKLALCLLIATSPVLLGQKLSLLKDITPGNDTTTPWLARDVENGYMYFHQRDSNNRLTLWRTDGSSQGTIKYADEQVMGAIRAIDGIVYFQSMNFPVSTYGSEVWRSDGTPAGTFMLKDINPNAGSSYPRDFVAFGDQVYFRTSYYKRKNGTPYPWLYNWELWKTDGSTAGTVRVASVDYHSNLTSTGSALLLDAVDLIASDGSGQGTVEIANVCPTFPADWSLNCYSTPYPGWPEVYFDTRKPVVIDGIYYLTMFSSAYGGELWRSDGTPAGTYQLTDINPGAGSSYPSFVVGLGGYLYFAAYSPDRGTELWRYPVNGTAFNQAECVRDIVSGPGGSEPMWLTEMEGKLYFSAYREAEGRELWVSDGTPSGSTQILADIHPGPLSSDPHYTSVQYDGGNDSDHKYCRDFARVGDRLYFPAYEPVHGYELWSSDGSSAGTTIAADINPGPASSFPKAITALNGTVLTTAYTPSVGWEWRVLSTGVNQSPVAVATGAPVAGAAPLPVSFTGSNSYDPEDGGNIQFAWDFGDGGSSSLADPAHLYQNAGMYTVVLTVTDQDNAASTDALTINVTTASNATVHVAAQTITRISLPGNKIAAENLILIKDENSMPVEGALVSADYTGATSGSVSGSTGVDGTVLFVSGRTKTPGNGWCFTVTDVQKSAYSYDPLQNVVTTACEATPKATVYHPATCGLNQNYPNPFNPSTRIVFSLQRSSQVTLIVTDALGREVVRLLDAALRPVGEHSVLFTAHDLKSGVYFCRLIADGHVETRSMMLLK